jgi:hypothetical protein
MVAFVDLFIFFHFGHILSTVALWNGGRDWRDFIRITSWEAHKDRLERRVTESMARSQSCHDFATIPDFWRTRGMVADQLRAMEVGPNFQAFLNFQRN